MDTRAKELVTIGDRLFSKKRQWDELAQDICEQFHPLRADYTSPFTLGTDFNTDLMESFPVQARATLGNTIAALLRQGVWFAIKTGIEELDENPVNARWLEDVTKRQRSLMYDRRANFVRATNEADHDWVTVGNPVLSVEESPDRTHLLYRCWHPKDAAWMENDVGRIDHLQRNMPMTARNLKMKSAWRANLHPDILMAADKEPMKEFKVRHVVLPFEEIYGSDRAKRRQYRDSPFCSLYIDCEHEVILGEGPLPVFNYVVPRYWIVGGFPQGFSPHTINALPDGRMLQQLASIILEQGEKAIDPPSVAKGEIFRDAVNMYAGGMTYVDLEADEKLQDVFQTIQAGAGLSFGMEMKQDVRNMIAEAFLLNKITLPPQEKTAFETQARLEEYRRAILPFTGPIDSVYHHELLDVTFQIAVKNRAFDIEEMPEDLQDRDITFAFEGPLNAAEGRKNVQAFQESIQILAGASQFDKSIPSTVDFKQMTKDAVKGTGAPQDWFAPKEVQQSAEEQQAAVDRLTTAASMLQGGAEVAGSTADAAIKLRQAGLA